MGEDNPVVNSIKKKKQKKRKHEDNEMVHTLDGSKDQNVDDSVVTSTKKKKHKKRKHEENEIVDESKEQNIEVADSEITPSKKGLAEEAERNGEESTKKKSKKRKKRQSEMDSSEVSQPEETLNNADSVTNEEGESVPEGTEEKTKRKKKSKKNKEKDIAEATDGEATTKEQPGKGVAAIEYLREWKNDRKNWKFKTVRQVWILQHMYDEKQVEESDFETVLEYIDGMKGKSRSMTVEEAEKLLAKYEEEQEKGEADTDGNSSAVKYERVRRVIQLLTQ